MKLIIDIPDEKYESIMEHIKLDRNFRECNVTELPKNTKRIVDADKLYYKKMYFEGSYKPDVVVFAKDIDKKSIMI